MGAPAVVLAGRYRLDGRIAVGGVGEVWRAADTALRRPVAVKLLRAEHAQHPEALIRFRAEARHAGSLSHPAIARVYDYGEDDLPYPPYLVMELVEGPSLAYVLSRGALGPARTMHVIAQAAAGLAAAHAAGLVHRDVKPANLLITQAGQVKITDFGIAHAAGSAPLTCTGTVVGTPAYLAPERVAGASGTPAADLYALGIVAYECLAGEPPFGGEPLVVAAAQRQRSLPRLPDEAPAEVRELVTALTQKEPADRPCGAGEVACEAARLAESLATAAGSDLRCWPVPAPAITPAVPTPAGVIPASPVTSREPGALTGAASGLAGAPARPDAGHGHPRGRFWPARAVIMTMAAAVVMAGMAGWLLGGVFEQPLVGHRPAAVAGGEASHRPARAASRPSGARTVTVNQASLVGQPVGAVRKYLRRLGLHVRVHWRQPGQRPRGTVVAVHPGGGPLPAHSVVVITATNWSGPAGGPGGRQAGGGPVGGLGQGSGPGQGRGNGGQAGSGGAGGGPGGPESGSGRVRHGGHADGPGQAGDGQGSDGGGSGQGGGAARGRSPGSGRSGNGQPGGGWVRRNGHISLSRWVQR